jgi:hypothetical protein
MQNTGTLKVEARGEREIVIAARAHEVADARPGRQIWRSIGAVFVGMLVIALLDNGIDFVMHTSGVYPPVGLTMADGLFLVALAYRTIDGILGCYVAARLAPHSPRRHALALGSIGVVLSSLGVVATWNGGPELGPLWYPLVLVAIALPCAWIGGTLAERQRGLTKAA